MSEVIPTVPLPDETGLRRMIRERQAAALVRPERFAGQQVPYRRRVEMSIPGLKADPARPGDKAAAREATLKLMQGAVRFAPDLAFYDLEDAAPDNPELKPWGRAFVAEALRTLPFPEGQLRGYRPNNLRTPFFEDDLLEVLRAAGRHVHVIVLPKCLYAADVADIQQMVRWARRAYGIEHRIWLEVLIEEATAFREADRIAALEDVAALLFGVLDFSGSVGGRVDPETWAEDTAYVRQALPVIAAAHGKQAVDAVTRVLPITPRNTGDWPVGDFRRWSAMAADEAGAAGAPAELTGQLRRRDHALGLARRDAESARRLGYAAKWVLHPAQLDPIAGAWTPARAEALWVLRLVADYARAAERGSGAELVAGTSELADKAVVRSAFWDVAHARHAGVLTDDDLAETGYSWAQLERSVKTRD